MIKSYNELILLPTFEERFEYLKVPGIIGQDTFGYDRYLNQRFYTSPEWKRIRREIILRDNCCDLGIPGREIMYSRNVIIHHMNPIAVTDILEHSQYALLPEFLICTSLDTHNALHYGDINTAKSKEPTVRKPNDTCPWRK